MAGAPPRTECIGHRSHVAPADPGGCVRPATRPNVWAGALLYQSGVARFAHLRPRRTPRRRRLPIRRRFLVLASNPHLARFRAPCTPPDTASSAIMARRLPSTPARVTLPRDDRRAQAMRKAYWLLAALVAVGLTGCFDNNTAPHVVATPPAAPRGLYSVTGDQLGDAALAGQHRVERHRLPRLHVHLRHELPVRPGRLDDRHVDRRHRPHERRDPLLRGFGGGRQRLRERRSRTRPSTTRRGPPAPTASW